MTYFLARFADLIAQLGIPSPFLSIGTMEEDQAPIAARALQQPRKFTIQSSFGQARERRSRKNRPCDACRRRKTACVIETEPPCAFCRSRGLICRSTPGPELTARQPALATPGSRLVGPAVSATPDPVLQPPARDIPAFQANASPDSLALPPPTGNYATTRQIAGSAAVVHQGLVHTPTGNPTDEVPLEAAALGVSPQSSVPSATTTRYTLEDARNHTAHFMGWAAEQDTYLLDAFRSVILSEYGFDANIIQVDGGNPKTEDPPVHFLLLENDFPEHTNRMTQAASDAIEALVWPHGPLLVLLYFKHVHPVYPIVSKVRFLRQYSAGKERIPASLRGAVYALACVFWHKHPVSGPCPFKQHELAAQAHTALRGELEAPNLWKLQSCLLLLHCMPPDIDSVETPYTWILACQATAAAQMIGLHQDPERWNIASWEKKLRRKLWWATYAADCWSAVCHGNPPHIVMDSFSTPPPIMDDLRSDEDVPPELSHLVDPDDTRFRVPDGARFLEMVRIAQDLRIIIHCSSHASRGLMHPSDMAQLRSQLVAIRGKLQDWSSLIPNCLALGQPQIGPLHLSFYASQVLLYRGLMQPATRMAKANPDSNLRRWFRHALDDFRAFVSFMSRMTETELDAFWGRHARSQLILCANFLIYLFLLASDARDIEVAYEMLETFQHWLHSLEKMECEHARLFLRSARLRIDSFFTQAAELIKHGGNEAYADPATVEASPS